MRDAEDQLRILLLKDTDLHPDVVSQRKLIEALKNGPTSADRGTHRPRRRGEWLEAVGAEPGF